MFGEEEVFEVFPVDPVHAPQADARYRAVLEEAVNEPLPYPQLLLQIFRGQSSRGFDLYAKSGMGIIFHAAPPDGVVIIGGLIGGPVRLRA